MAMTLNPSDPIVLITRPLEQFRKLASHDGVSYTNAQMLQKCLSLIRSTRHYGHALTLWDSKSTDGKIWANFKTHIHEAQLQLKHMRGPIMRQSGCHQANELSEKCNLNSKKL